MHRGPTFKNITDYTLKARVRMLDRWLDCVLYHPCRALDLGFARNPIRNGRNLAGPISDVQAIVSYVFDSFLVGQQLNGYEKEMEVAVVLESRILSHKRMLKKIHQEPEQEHPARLLELIEQQQDGLLEFSARLPSEILFGRVITEIAHVLGHVVTACLFF